MYFLKYVLFWFFICMGAFATNKVIKHVEEARKIYKEHKIYHVGAIFEKNNYPNRNINPFYDDSKDYIRCEILDIKNNKDGEPYVKFRYLTPLKFCEHNNDEDNKISNIYSETLDEFKKRFVKNI